MRVVSIDTAQAYYTEDNYYSKDKSIENSEWFGSKTNALCLKDKIVPLEFQTLLHGRTVQGRRIRFQSSKQNLEESYKNYVYERLERSLERSHHKKKDTILKKIKDAPFPDSREKKTALLELLKDDCDPTSQSYRSLRVIIRKTKKTQFRAGIDLTFSAPKSVSLLALVEGQKDVLKAHTEAVKDTLSYIEKHYIQSRVRKDDKRLLETTGNLTAGLFLHDTSRENDPQLHTHAVVMNGTQCKDKKWRSLHNDSLFQNSLFFGSIYQNQLAFKLKNLGYTIVTQDNGTFEVAGYTKQELDEFSKRRKQILALGGGSQKENRFLVLKNRKSKVNIASTDLKTLWEGTAKSLGILTIQRKTSKTQSKIPLKTSFAKNLEISSERDVKTRFEDFSTAVMKTEFGARSFFDIERKIKYFLKNTTERSQKKDLNVHKNHLDKENTLITLAKEERTKKRHTTQACLDSLLSSNSLASLNTSQKEAVSLVLKHQEKRCLLWQGVAGSGKTRSLRAVHDILKKEGERLVAISPKANTAKLVSLEAGIPDAFSVSKFLSLRKDEKSKYSLFVVDEAGLLSNTQCLALIKEAKHQNARLLLVGDKHQLPPIDAGKPFELLQDKGLPTAILEKGLRQKTELLKETLRNIQEGDLEESLRTLDKNGNVLLYTRDHDRYKAMSKDYTKDPENTLLVTTTHKEKSELNTRIREELKKTKRLRGTDLSLNRYQAKNLPKSALAFAKNYKEGEVFIPDMDCFGLKKGESYTVSSVSKKENCLKLKHDNKTIERDPRFFKGQLYTQESFPLARGELIRATKNMHNKTDRIYNGECYTILDLKKDSVTLLNTENKAQIKGKTALLRHFDYGYVSTSYSSQGLSASRVLVHDSSIKSHEKFYVDVTRAKHELKIYTKDKEALYAGIQRKQDKSSALKLL